MLKYIILIEIFILFFYYSEFNQKKIGNFTVHATGDAKSADTFAEIDRRIEVLKKHLKAKYECKTCGFLNKSNITERIDQLDRNYKRENFREISPFNMTGNTSFTENKGRRVVMCLRDKNNKIHDTNTIMFVVLHEVTHIMSPEWGHPLGFWKLFQFILLEAIECKIYTPVNYSKHPQSYCGIIIDQSPLF